MKKKILSLILVILILAACPFCIAALYFPRPYRKVVDESGISRNLVYAIMKTESGFSEKAKSSAGAIGLMQIKPSTAEFICRREEIEFHADALTDGKYNIKLACLYLKYLFERFPVTETALAAYNAGEGTVSGWLKDRAYSEDGERLHAIPYPETRNYLEKISRTRKIYDFLYRY